MQDVVRDIDVKSMETTTFSQFANDQDVNEALSAPHDDFIDRMLGPKMNDIQNEFNLKREQLVQLSLNISLKQQALDELYKEQKELADERSSVDMIVEV